VTHALIADGGAFTVNVLDREDRAIVRKFTKPVDVDGSSANGFPFVDAPVSGCPILETAVAYVDCRVWKTVDVGTSTLFIGEVVDAGFQKAEDTPVLRMEDTRMNYGG
jgi:flavin reductase (DIM6/NTAB) family NADH-FMN oxidoreductase RutF